MCQCDQVSYHSNWIEPLTHHPLSGPPDLFSFWCETLKFPLLAFWLNCPSMAAPPALCISAAQIGIDITAANPYSNESFLPHCWPINQLFPLNIFWPISTGPLFVMSDHDTLSLGLLLTVSTSSILVQSRCCAGQSPFWISDPSTNLLQGTARMISSHQAKHIFV